MRTYFLRISYPAGYYHSDKTIDQKIRKVIRRLPLVDTIDRSYRSFTFVYKQQPAANKAAWKLRKLHCLRKIEEAKVLRYDAEY